MEAILNELYNSSSTPFWSAIILGLMTAISPCPMATNITAIGFIGRNIQNRNRVFINGIVYTGGRALAYTLLAMILYVGADHLSISGVFQRYGEKIIGPLLIIIGLFMLDIISIKMPGLNRFTKRYENQEKHSYKDILLLGVLFALAFCPYSAVLYFGMLIPITISSPQGLILPLFFAIATGIPVIIFSWILAYALSSLGNAFDKIKVFEFWFRKVVATLFILIGLYYIYNVFI